MKSQTPGKNIYYNNGYVWQEKNIKNVKTFDHLFFNGKDELINDLLMTKYSIRIRLIQKYIPHTKLFLISIFPLQSVCNFTIVRNNSFKLYFLQWLPLDDLYY